MAEPTEMQTVERPYSLRVVDIASAGRGATAVAEVDADTTEAFFGAIARSMEAGTASEIWGRRR
jgi:hypothetical protein